MFPKAHFLLRSCVQIFAFAIFTFQMKLAVEKYMSKPEIDERLDATLDDVLSPLVYVCNDNQFDYGKAAAHGYQSHTDFLAGNVTNSNTPSWMGNTTNGNLTPDILFENLHNFNYSDVENMKGNNKTVNITTLGFCMKIANFSMDSYVEICTKEPMRFYILDPYRSTALRVEQILGHSRKLTKGSEGFSFSHYKISFELHDDTLHDGDNCKDYSKDDGNFGDCFQQELEYKLTKWFGCLPIWYPTDSIKCSQPHNVEANDYLRDFLDNADNTSCKPSCYQLKMNFMLVDEITNFPKYSLLNVKFDKNVQVYKRVYSYDAFSLIVELGSALGLWIGLSAIGLLDIIIEACCKAKQSVDNHLKHVSNS